VWWRQTLPTIWLDASPEKFGHWDGRLRIADNHSVGNVGLELKKWENSLFLLQFCKAWSKTGVPCIVNFVELGF
jgi:hypothetical protein